MKTLEACMETIVEVACDIRESGRRVDKIAWDIQQTDLSVPRLDAKGLGSASIAIGRLSEALKREHPADNGIMPLLESLGGDEMPVEMGGVVKSQTYRAVQLGRRVAALGRSINDVQLRIAGALRDVNDWSIDTLVLTILEAAPANKDEITRALRTEMNSVAEAKADWRLSMGSPVTFQIADAFTGEEIDAALRRLLRTRAIRRNWPPFGRYVLSKT